MKQCGQCGAQNLDHQAACTACGSSLQAVAGGLGGTLLISGTEKVTPQEPPAKLNLKGTMLGIAPPVFVPPPTSTSASASGQASESGAAPGGGDPEPARARPFGATMIGGILAPSFPAPPPPPPPEALPATVSAAQTQASATSRLASAHKTVLGIARPGIAPLNPGQVKETAPAPASAAASPVAAATAPLPPLGAPPPPASGGAPISPGRNVHGGNRISVFAALAIIGSAMLLVAAVVALFMLRGRGSVTAKAGLDENGAELLEVACTECPDGTKTWIDSSPATFRAGKAQLKVPAPLKVGENPLLLVLERPGRSREEIALSIPIEFRVRGSTEELSQDPPKVAVLASALAGTKLEIDGKLVAADPSWGSTRIDFDVSSDITGPEASMKTLERSVPYRATSSDGAAREGKVEIRIGITPLIVDAPGASITVAAKDIVLAGRTAPGAVLRIGQQNIVLDAEGRFVSKQPLGLGENAFTVRSTLKGHAPRLVKVTVHRTDNLEREAALAKAAVQTSYPAVLAQGDSAVGQSLVLEGQLFDLRHDGYTSVLLVDVKDGCKRAPCLAKVLHGVESHLDKGHPIKAFGKVVRFVEGARAGERIPEMRAELVVIGGS